MLAAASITQQMRFGIATAQTKPREIPFPLDTTMSAVHQTLMRMS